MDLNINYVAKLAKIKLTPQEEKKFSDNLVKILDHFNDLQAVDTEGIIPLTGGHDLKNVSREDKTETFNDIPEILCDAFPDRDVNYLKVPPVFSTEGGFVSSEE